MSPRVTANIYYTCHPVSQPTFTTYVTPCHSQHLLHMSPRVTANIYYTCHPVSQPTFTTHVTPLHSQHLLNMSPSVTANIYYTCHPVHNFRGPVEWLSGLGCALSRLTWLKDFNRLEASVIFNLSLMARYHTAFIGSYSRHARSQKPLCVSVCV